MADLAILQAMHLQLQLNMDQLQNMIVVLQLQRRQRRRNRRARRTVWARNWLLRRDSLGYYSRLMRELEDEDPDEYRRFIRHDPPFFAELVQRLGPRIMRYDNNFRKPLSPGLMIAITLRYLASGNSYLDLSYGFRVARNTISLVVKEVCEALVAEYHSEAISTPSTPAEWKEKSKLFSQRWQFHNTVGALDGKHVAIRRPAGGGSMFYNYKKFHSIVLLGLADANYEIFWLDIGANGACSDAQIWNSSNLKGAILDDTAGLPEPQCLPGDDKEFPHFIIADDAFALQDWMMKPFGLRRLTTEERIFNYRLSRARRVVENAFGIMCARYRCMLGTMLQHHETVTTIVTAVVCLHNISRKRYPVSHVRLMDREDRHHNLIPGAWRRMVVLDDVQAVTVGTPESIIAKKQRLELKHYYNSPAGEVPWQNRMIRLNLP